MLYNFRITLDAAIYALEAAKYVHRAGFAVAEAMLTFGLDGLINIRKLSFDVRLAVAEGGHFRGEIDVMICNNRLQMEFNINIQSVSSMVDSLVETVKDNIL